MRRNDTNRLVSKRTSGILKDVTAGSVDGCVRSLSQKPLEKQEKTSPNRAVSNERSDSENASSGDERSLGRYSSEERDLLVVQE